VPANVGYPTDSGLLAKGVAKLARTVDSLKQLGFGTRTSFRDRTRSVRRRATRSAPGSGGVTTTPRPRCSSSPASSPTSPRRPSPRLSLSPATPDGPLSRAGKAASHKAVALVGEIEQTAGLLEQIVTQTRTRIGRRDTRRLDEDRLAARPRRPADRGREGSASRSNSATKPRFATTPT